MLRVEILLRSCAAVALLAAALVGLEWLFFVTKPSFFDASPWALRLASGWVASLGGALAALGLHLCGIVVAVLLSASPRTRKGAGWALAFVPALLLASTALLLVDNFTYTLFGWGVVSTSGFALLLYALAALVAFGFVWRRTRREVFALGARTSARAAGAWLVACLVAGGTLFALGSPKDAQLTELDLREDRPLPNIILFASDGINARRTSAYGYHLPTTPELDRHLDRGWLFENAFTNAGRTTGSLTAMATGRLPTTTKVLFPPYTLQGSDAFANLPRILRGLGYRNIQESVRYYADGPDLNWRESFDFANDRWLRDRVSDPPEFLFALQLPGQLLASIEQRLSERVMHLTGIQAMRNVHSAVTVPELAKVYGTTDQTRMERLFRFIDESDGPFFAHVHLMGTHCCRFRPKKPFYSAEPTGDGEQDWEARYDDVIRESDEHFGALMDFLESRDLLDDTLIVYSSDHPRRWGFRDPVPLIFFFPDQRRVGRSQTSAQLVDVAPTILDYLGQPIPPWMEGDSLLRDDVPTHRPIFTVVDVEWERFVTSSYERLWRVRNTGPPTYGMSRLAMLLCDRWFTVELRGGSVESGLLSSFEGNCAPEDWISEARAKEMIVDHLNERGFSVLEPPAPEIAAQ